MSGCGQTRRRAVVGSRQGAGRARGPYIRRMRTPLVAAGLLFALVSALPAQQENGRYQPIAAWTTPYVEHLIRAGVLRDPDPLTRPLRRADLRRALSEVDTAASPSAVRAIIRLLARELEEPVDSVRWRLGAAVGALAASDARRWAERPAADSAGLFPQAGLAMSLEMPHLTLVTHPAIDNRLLYDPDYTGKKDRIVAGRNEDAYVLFSSRYLDAFFGIEDRNWGPPVSEGLLLSPSPYGFDHLLLRIGPRRLRLEMLVTQLDALTPWTDSARAVTRGLTLHRLVVTPSDAVAFSFFEGLLYAGTPDGPRFLEPWYVNPLNSLLLAQYQDAPQGNSLLGFDVTTSVGRAARLSAQFYLDDFQVDRGSAGDREPPSYGFTILGTGGFRRGALSWSAVYTRVTNLSYRTPANQEQYTLRGVGIARNFSDYDQATFRVTSAAAPRLLVTGEATMIRQGEGDMRLRYPAISDFPSTATFLQGVVERTVRLGAQGVWTPRADATLSADLARHFVTNAGHVAGASEQRWVWRIRAELRRSYSGVVRW